MLRLSLELWDVLLGLPVDTQVRGHMMAFCGEELWWPGGGL